MAMLQHLTTEHLQVIPLAFETGGVSSCNLASVYAAERACREELEIAYQAMSAIFASTPDGMLILNSDGIILHGNPIFCTWIGETELVGRPVADVLGSDQLTAAIEQLNHNPNAPNRIEITLNSTVRRLLVAQIHCLQAGTFRGWLVNLYDQSDRRRLEHQKMEFINIAAHELRTPLAAVIGFGELLQQHIADDAPDQDRDCLEGILRGSYRLKVIVDEIIAFAKLNRGAVAPPGVLQFSLAEVVAEVVTEMQERAAQLRVRLEVGGIDPALTMRIDMALLHTILSQLLLNAINFNVSDGCVCVEVRLVEQQVAIRISDTGIGIAPADLEAVFQPFYQVEDYRVRRVGGLGLGLAIVRRSVDQLGGSLAVESTPGAGTRVDLLLPLHQPAPETVMDTLRDRLAAALRQAEAHAQTAEHLYTELQRHSIATLAAITEALEARDTYTRGHSDRVAALARCIARRMGYSERELQILEIAGHIHDIGMIGIPDSILSQAGPLSEIDNVAMQQHIALGRAIVAPLEFLHEVLPAAFAHHERWDGHGYPDGLSGEAIPLDGRILAVADAYDAMTSPRPYREAMSGEQALALIAHGAGSQWDPTVVRIFLDLMQTPAA